MFSVFITIYILIPFICMIGIKKQDIVDNGITKDSSLEVRGLGILLIVYTHMAYAHITMTTFFYYVTGVVGVAACFLMSGYGLDRSYTAKKNYLDHFWFNKILRLAIPFWVIYLLYISISFLAGTSFSLASITHDILTFSFPGTLLWYLKIQFLMYIIFWIAYRFLPTSRTKVIGVFFGTILYMVIASAIKLEHFWYNACLFFPLGLLLSQYQNKIFPYIRKKSFLFLSCLGTVLLFLFIFFFGHMNFALIIDNAYMLCFCCVFLWAFQHFTGFYVLRILGFYSIEVYLIHTIIGHYFNSEYALSYILLPLISVILSVPTHWLIQKASLFLERTSKR